jgi:single-strand DNA-binding protein
MSLLQLTAIGNVGHSPRFKDVGDKRVANFSIGTSRKVKGERVTTWVDVSCWSDNRNKVIDDYVKKGTRVFVQGTPRTRAFQNREGEWIAQLEVDITFGELVLLGDKQEEGEGRETRPREREATRPSSRAPANQQTPEMDPLYDDDIPF